MDDIAGLSWGSTPANGQKAAPSTSNYSAFSTLKPTPPTSGRASPLIAPPSQPPSKPATPANDSFANLISFGGTSNKNLSLLEQQKRQTEAKILQQKAQSQKLNEQYAGGEDQFWNNLGSGKATPANGDGKNIATNTQSNGLDDDEDDLFAVFNKPAAVKPATAKGLTVTIPVQKPKVNDDDDDPFGLAQNVRRRVDTPTTATTVDSNDVLGLLGQPASARPRQTPTSPVRRKGPADVHPQDKAVAELVDMGFPADKAKMVLEGTDSGINVQAAVGILLNQAHAKARQKSQPKPPNRQGVDDWVDAQAPRTKPRWDDEDAPRRREKVASPAPDKDFEKMASELGSNFLKTANSLWKQGTKRVQQAVQEFNSDSDTSTIGAQPKWMREEPERLIKREQSDQQEAEPVSSGRKSSPESRVQPNMTDEAMMLEGNRPTPPPRPSTSSQRPDRRLDSGADSSRDHSPAMPSRLRESLPTQPAFLRQQNRSPALDSKARLTKAATEEQAAQAYVSSARRRKPQPQPTSSEPLAAPVDADLLEGGFKDSTSPPRAPSIVNKPTVLRPQSQPVRSPVSTPPIQVRPPPPARPIPTVSSIALKASHTAREKGNEHFKRGDYASAHQSYGTSLSHLPDTHPLNIILLTNRALTGLKTGEPKSAIVDADKVILLIGPSKGENETVTTGDDTVKPMRDYFGKALMRKAEALETMEKWIDAALVWREAVEGGHGGATSIQGRLRAEKAANPSNPKPKPSSATTTSRNFTPSRPTAQKPAEAVSRLRAANAAADQVDDEKFRLGDTVDARISAWKSGKQDNLRALLGSLDNVLWEGSGWKKVGLADLVLPSKVKVVYMKGIARVHPDKVRLSLFLGEKSLGKSGKDLE